MRTAAEHLFAVVLWSLVGAILSAGLFVVVLHSNLPPGDLAHGQPPFAEPLVLPIMLAIAGLSAVGVVPVAYFALRTANLVKATIVAYGFVALEIVLVTPSHPRAGWMGACLAILAALVFCSRSKWVNSHPEQAV